MNSMQQQSSPLVVESFILQADRNLPCKKYLNLHRNRFFESVRFISENLQVKFSSEDIIKFNEFWQTVILELSQFSKPAFPRISCSLESGSPVYEIIYRPCPPISDSLSFITAAHSSNIMGNTKFAGVKGPNIATYQNLINKHGGEILLLDDAGTVLEGTTTSIVWWQEGILYTVPKSNKRVNSITEDLVMKIAESLDVKVSTQTLTPEKLQNKTVWALNALHGIRKVDQVNGHTLPDNNYKLMKNFIDAYDKIKCF